VVVWAEEPDNSARYVVKRLDFTVSAGTLSKGAPQHVLPLPGEVIPPDEFLFYGVPRVWGTPDHSSIFVATGRTHVAADGVSDVSRKWIIYDLNDPTQFRVVFEGLAADGSRATLGDCSGVVHGQFVSDCYVVDGLLGLTAAGTRLYLTGQANGWGGTLRLDVSNRDSGDNLLPLSAWSFGPPELVVTAPRDAAAYTDVGVWGERPQLDGAGVPHALGPEHAGITYLDRTGKQTVRKGLFIDADLCVQAYATQTSGIAGGPIDLWRTHCSPTSPHVFYDAFAGELRSVWESADTVLQAIPGRRNAIDIHRRHVTGPYAGTSQLLIQGADFPDAGY
jgi:hypothetical protein